MEAGSRVFVGLEEKNGVVAKSGKNLVIGFRSTRDGRNFDCEMTQY